jgi:hypothetical protein
MLKRMTIAIVVAALAVFAISAHAEDRPGLEIVGFPSNGEPKPITQIADLPRRLMAAIARTDCRLEDGFLRDFPAVLFRPSPLHLGMALVPCPGFTPSSYAFLFESNARTEPRLLYFPVISLPQGFSASYRPGLMRWYPDTKQLIATGHTDMCGSVVARHTYQPGGGELNGFALTKVEVMPACAVPETWKPYWDATAWPKVEQ